SSRRRHTRFSRDWSSDVCSSDLPDERLPLLENPWHAKENTVCNPPRLARWLGRRDRPLGARTGRLGRVGGPSPLLDERKVTVTGDRKSTRLNSSHVKISYAVFCL